MRQGFVSGINLSTKHQFIDASVTLSNLINALTILIIGATKNLMIGIIIIVIFLEYREEII